MSNVVDEHEVWPEDSDTGYIPDDDEWEDEEDEDYGDDFRDERYNGNEQLE